MLMKEAMAWRGTGCTSMLAECTFSSAPPPLLLSTADSTAHSAAACGRSQVLLFSGQNRQQSEPRARPRPCRFASITLGGAILDRLPKLTQRGQIYDPWASDCPEAPRGVLGSHRKPVSGQQPSELAVRASLAACTPPDAMPGACSGSGAAPAGRPSDAGPHPQATPLLAQNPQQQHRQQHPVAQSDALRQRPPRPQDTDSELLHDAGDQAAPRPRGGGGAQQPARSGHWLAKLVPKLPGSPSELRNRWATLVSAAADGATRLAGGANVQ